MFSIVYSWRDLASLHSYSVNSDLLQFSHFIEKHEHLGKLSRVTQNVSWVVIQSSCNRERVNGVYIGLLYSTSCPSHPSRLLCVGLLSFGSSSENGRVKLSYLLHPTLLKFFVIPNSFENVLFSFNFYKKFLS